MTPVHKRSKVSVEANYRPVTVLDNLETVFEDCTKQQFEKWITAFIPEWQYGFVSKHGTTDYGTAISFTLQACLKRRQKGLLIATDIAGAFDRCWWKRILNRLEAAGMRGRALKLMRSYLQERFIQVVAAGRSSSLKQIFSGVPQGAKWSSLLWDFDISEMCEDLEGGAIPFGYADDVSLWYEIDPKRDLSEIVADINKDLAHLLQWGTDNNTTFEKSKMEMVVVSQKRSPFDPTGATFDDFQIPHRPHIKLVGFTVDSKLRWGPMIDRIAKKARSRIGALRRINHHLDCHTMRTMYTSFIRSIMEFGSVAWMGCAQTHLDKLDRVQASAQKISGFTVPPLQLRREAAAVSFALKMLDGACKGVLNDHVPILDYPLKDSVRPSRHKLGGVQIQSMISAKSLDTTARGFFGALPGIWSRLPQDLTAKGMCFGWLKIKSRCVAHILKKNSSGFLND